MSRSPDPLGRYAIEKILASDGARRVVLARDEARQRSVSILSVAIVDSGARTIAMRRARSALAIEHPSIAAVYEVGESGDDLFIVTEPLRALAERSEAVFLDVARGLAAAHKRGIHHGAVDRFSVWQAADGETKLVGFGTGTGASADAPEADVAALCALAGRRDSRSFASMGELLHALERAAEAHSAKPSARRSPRWAIAGCAIALGTMGLLDLVYRLPAWRATPVLILEQADAARPATAKAHGQSVDPRANALFEAALQSRRDAAMPVARATLDEALRADPAFAAAHLYRAIWWYGIDDEARTHLARASDLRANLTTHERTILAAFEPLMRSAQDAALAIERLTRAALDDPDDADLRFYTGVAHFVAGDFPHAITSMSEAYARDPSLAEALRLEAYFRAYIGDAQAAALYERCIAVSPAATHCMRGLAMVYRFGGRGQDALALARRMIALDPSSSSASFELAEALECVGAPDDAVSEALEHDASLAPARVRGHRAFEVRAKHAILHGRFDEALRHVDAWDAAIADEADEETHFAPVQTRVDLLLEVGRAPDARVVIDAFLKRRAAWTPPAMLDNITIIAWGQAYRAAALSRDAFATRRASWLSDLTTKPRAWVDDDARWVLAYAMPLRVDRDAVDAVGALEALGRGRTLHPSFFKDPNTYDGNLGLTLLRAGYPSDALPPLHRAASTCEAIDEPFEHIWARMAEGQALDALGRTSDACAAYRDVLAHWGASGSRSATAARARHFLAQCEI